MIRKRCATPQVWMLFQLLSNIKCRMAVEACILDNIVGGHFKASQTAVTIHRTSK